MDQFIKVSNSFLQRQLCGKEDTKPAWERLGVCKYLGNSHQSSRILCTTTTGAGGISNWLRFGEQPIFAGGRE